MRVSKVIANIILASTLTIPTSSLAAVVEKGGYYNNYYEDEGDLLFKLRGFYASVSSKPKSFSDAYKDTQKPGSLVSVSFGADAALTYFFADNIAAELSTGIGLMRVKNSALSTAASSFGDGTGTLGKNNNIYMVPVTATLQYHVAPFGAIRPYVGGGYHGTYMYTSSRALKTSSGHGPVAQLGVDFIAKDDTFFTIDVRQYFLKSNVTFKKDLLTGNQNGPDVSSKVSWNPLIVSVGVGFKF